MNKTIEFWKYAQLIYLNKKNIILCIEYITYKKKYNSKIKNFLKINK